MNWDIIREFISLDQKIFDKIIKKFGYQSAACYKLVNNSLINIISSIENDKAHWAPITDFNFNYTSKSKYPMLMGWYRPTPSERLEIWHENTYFYLPEQDMLDVKIVFAVKLLSPKQIKSGNLELLWEVLAKRINLILKKDTLYSSFNNKNYEILSHQLKRDFKSLIDHNIRTPLTILIGCFDLLKSETVGAYEYIEQIDFSINQLHQSLCRLDQIFSDQNKITTEILDIRYLVNNICEEIKKSLEKDSYYMNKQFEISCTYSNHVPYLVKAEKTMLSLSIGEVIRNAMSFHSVSKIAINIYLSGQNCIIDICDNGIGVTKGLEELIFMRFFQDPSDIQTRRDYKGLGVGLSIAKQIIEQHMGQLYYAQEEGKNGSFRFILPLTQ